MWRCIWVNGYNFGRLARWPRSDAVVFLTAFVLTVVVDLTVAVEIGMVLAAVVVH